MNTCFLTGGASIINSREDRFSIKGMLGWGVQEERSSGKLLSRKDKNELEKAKRRKIFHA